jgi:hypothetical protein
MRRHINLLALLVIVAGGAVIARPTPASATYINPWDQKSCCRAMDPWGKEVGGCCGASGCYINSTGCYGW